MALITNNISGSSAGFHRIGITGSLTIANPGARPYPTVPGADVDLFVSGNIGGVGAGQGVTLFGGDVVISGTLHGGSPLKIGTDVGLTGSFALNNLASAPTAGANEAVLYARLGTLYFKNAGGGETAVGSGGGGGGGPFTEASNVAAYTTSSIAIGQQAVANTKGTDVFFFVSGSTGGDKTALFGGTIVTSGALQVSGPSTLTGDATFGGNIVADADEAKSIFAAVTSNAITIGGNTSTTTVRNLTVNGTTITATTPTTINLGDTAATVNVGQSGTSNVLNVRGNANVTGNATITGNLTVNGTTTTVNTTNLVVKDPLVYLASASAPGPVTYGGIAIASGSGENNQALLLFRDFNGTEAIWSAGRQDVSGGLSTSAVDVTYHPVRASKFELGGTLGGSNTAFVTTPSAGIVDVQGTQARIISTTSPLVLSGATGLTNGVQIRLNGLVYGQIRADGNNITFGSPNNNAILSGSTVALQHFGGGAVDFTKDTSTYFRINSGPTATQLLGNTDASLLIAPWSGATAKDLVLSGTNVVLSGSTEIQFVRNNEEFAFVGLSPVSNLKGLHPGSDSAYNLGSPQLRWANIYTGDLHLRNERGDWTIIEERDYLSITNNYNGKRYKFVLEEI